MEIRNALIVLTKVSSVFPVTRKSGVNLEKRVRENIVFFHVNLSTLMIHSLCDRFHSFQVTKIKGDEREDLKVLATGVAAALAARKVKF